jgi:TRAP-type uncharacterized transport system fused permease subunit
MDGGASMNILEQLITAKGYEYMIAVGFIFLFILFYSFLMKDKIEDE